jgi:hypothetical protein
MLPDTKTVIMKLDDAAASGASVIGTIDTLGYDYLEVDVIAGSASAAEVAVAALHFGETDDTAAHSDVETDMDLIPAFTGGAAVSPTVGFVLPARSSTVTNLYRFNMDLRGRKRYIGCHFEPLTTITEGVAIIGRLSRAHVGPAMATAAIGVSGARLIVSG